MTDSEDDRRCAEGRRAGGEWASGGDRDQVRRLAEVVGQTGGPDAYAGAWCGGDEGSAAAIHRHLTGNLPEVGESADFWEDEVGLGAGWAELADSEPFARGFVQAVIEVAEKK